MASNFAAWMKARQTKPLVVEPAPLGTPAEHQILVKNAAIAVNPLDFKLQEYDFFGLRYPNIFGLDIAGEVVAVGPGVTRFQIGDRVMGHPIGLHNKNEHEKGFQLYTIVRENMASRIPDSMAFETAVVLPLCLSTAAASLFQDDMLGLQLPTVPAQKPTGKTLLVWGGASSVGCNAIQLAAAAGYEVITTASAKNVDFLKSLGASEVFDYNSPTLVSDLAEALKGKDTVGAVDTVGGATRIELLEVVTQFNGAKVVAAPARGPEMGGEVTVKNVYSPTISGNHVSTAVYQDFMPQALEAGTFVPAPKPLVAGKGLESVQGAIDLVGKGLSAQKVVVTL